MSSEIVVPEIPFWLNELEAKREKRLKARLGHEAGAGAPCLKCGDKCPVLPGKQDELELDWAPKGHKETVDKYLKTLPPEQLPVKGSQAAQNRKQLLQRQIPVHDVDPTLCHELTDDELKKMNEYIANVKQSSVGVGQIVSLSSIIKGNLHIFNPGEAAILANRYSKGIPSAEIVTLQTQSRSEALRRQNLNENLKKLNLNEKNLPNYICNNSNIPEHMQNALVYQKVHDLNYPGYTNENIQSMHPPQFSSKFKPNHYKGSPGQENYDTTTIDQRFLQNPNFDPKKIPSGFVTQHIPNDQSIFKDSNILGKNLDDYKSGTSAFVPYSKSSTVFKPGENISRGGTPQQQYTEESILQNPNYSKIIPHYANTNSTLNKSRAVDPNNKNIVSGQSELKEKYVVPGGNPVNILLEENVIDQDLQENTKALKKARGTLPNYTPGKYILFPDHQSPTRLAKNVKDLAFSTYDPTNVDPNELKNEVDPTYKDQMNIPEDPFLINQNIARQIISGSPNHLADILRSKNPEQPSSGNTLDKKDIPYYLQTDIDDRNRCSKKYAKPIKNTDSQFDTYKSNDGQTHIDDQNRFSSSQHGNQIEYPRNLSDINKQNYLQTVIDDQNAFSPRQYAKEIKNPNVQNHLQTGIDEPNQFSPGQYPARIGNRESDFDIKKQNYLQKSTDDQNKLSPRQFVRNLDNQFDSSKQNYPREICDPNLNDDNNTQQSPYNSINKNTPRKKLSELHPSNTALDEDFLHPSQVNIGAIQDLNYPEIKAAVHGTSDFYEDYSPDSIKEILNNIKLPDCHYCKKSFDENEFAVTIDRANVLFHAECFRCAGCNQILADNVYFYNKETDNIYCGRDYAKVRGFPRCKACDELIFTKEYCLAENATFHLKHFCCMECDIPLAGQDYTLDDGMPYCLPCFEQSKANKCSGCGRIIKTDETGCALNGVHFHAVDECFACKICKKPLMGKKLLLRNQKLYCSHDCFGTDIIE